MSTVSFPSVNGEGASINLGRSGSNKVTFAAPITSGPTLFQADNYGTLQAWYSANNPTATGAPLADGTAVTTWSDLSGNARHLSATLSITAKDNIVGTGTKWLRFDNNGSYMESASFSQTANYSLYVVFKANINFGPGQYLIQSWPNFRYLAREANWQAVAFNTVPTTFTADVAGFATDANVFSIVSNGTTLDLRLNGGTSGTGAESGTMDSGAGPLTVYGSGWGLSSYGEIVLYSGAHDNTTRTTIERALGTQYGITVA